MELPSGQFSDVRFVGPAGTEPGGPGLPAFPLSYPVTKDAWWCNSWCQYLQQRTRVVSVCCIRRRTVMSGPKAYGRSLTAVASLVSKLRISSPSLAITVLVTNWLNKWFTTLAYDVMVPSCRLTSLADGVNRILKAARAGPDMNFLKSQTLVPSWIREEPHTCFHSVNKSVTDS